MKTPLLTMAAAALASGLNAQDADRVQETMSSPYDGRHPVSLTFRLPSPAATNFAEADTAGWSQSCKRRGPRAAISLVNGVTRSPMVEIEKPFMTRQNGRQAMAVLGLELAAQRYDFRQIETEQNGSSRRGEIDRYLTPVLRAGVVFDYARIPLAYTPPKETASPEVSLSRDELMESRATYIDLYLQNAVGLYRIFNMQDAFDREINYTAGEITEAPVEQRGRQGLYMTNMLNLSFSGERGGRDDQAILGVGVQTIFDGNKPEHRLALKLSFGQEFFLR